jgi:tRNA pseudouridine38-40 synthase
MPRYKLTLEYDGTGLVGWQKQPNGPSVQEILETAFERFCGEQVLVAGAGRTDAGVHALGQAAHVDLPRAYPPDEIRGAVNHHIGGENVAVLAVEPVADGFDARRSARGRHYTYLLVNRRAPLTLERGRAWHVGAPLDADAMHGAAQLLVGHHDFTTFRDSLCQAKSPVKTLDELSVVREGERIRVTARARSFLHHQVRNMVGTLKLVGLGKWSAADLRTALEARDRRRGGPTAPPDGLYLVNVIYGPPE